MNRKPILSVVVPCLNETANLPFLVERTIAALSVLGLAGPDAAEIVLIDDGSEDGTWSCIERLGRATAAVLPVRHPRTQGISAAWRTGLARATGDLICLIDADLQYEPEEIPRLWTELHRTGADIVQGARSRSVRRGSARFVLSRGLNGILNLVFGMSLRDNKSGFFLCRREVLADLLSFRGRYRHWQCFVMVAAHCRGYRIHQIETPFHQRRAGRSAFGRVAVLPALAVMIDLVRAVREYHLGRS